MWRARAWGVNSLHTPNATRADFRVPLMSSSDATCNNARRSPENNLKQKLI